MTTVINSVFFKCCDVSIIRGSWLGVKMTDKVPAVQWQLRAAVLVVLLPRFSPYLPEYIASSHFYCHDTNAIVPVKQFMMNSNIYSEIQIRFHIPTYRLTYKSSFRADTGLTVILFPLPAIFHIKARWVNPSRLIKMELSISTCQCCLAFPAHVFSSLYAKWNETYIFFP